MWLPWCVFFSRLVLRMPHLERDMGWRACAEQKFWKCGMSKYAFFVLEFVSLNFECLGKPHSKSWTEANGTGSKFCVSIKVMLNFFKVRRFVVQLDSAQYLADVQQHRCFKFMHRYSPSNLFIQGKVCTASLTWWFVATAQKTLLRVIFFFLDYNYVSQYFEGVLETVRGLINSEVTAVPPWLKDVFLVRYCAWVWRSVNGKLFRESGTWRFVFKELFFFFVILWMVFRQRYRHQSWFWTLLTRFLTLSMWLRYAKCLIEVL